MAAARATTLRARRVVWCVSPSLRVRWAQAMSSGLRAWLLRLRGRVFRDESPRLADETRWYTEHTALLISTLKWAMLGAVAGVCVGLGTRAFLWTLDRSADWARALTPAQLPVFFFLPIALPICVWIIR